MIHRPLRAVLFAAGIAAFAALPVLGRALRSGGVERCDFDGVAVPPAARVSFVEGAAGVRTFCCIDCARAWLAKAGAAPARILVTDETSGRAVSAAEAWFVRSRVPSPGAPGSNLHVFADEGEARRHAAAFRGVVLEGGARPFPRKEGSSR